MRQVLSTRLFLAAYLICCGLLSFNLRAESQNRTLLCSPDEEAWIQWQKRCVEDAGSIVFAQYQHCEPQIDGMPITWSSPPIAVFKVLNKLKGPPTPELIRVRFDFYDPKRFNRPPEGWSFSTRKMPKPGSEWILFLKKSSDFDFVVRTHGGPFGRVKATNDALETLVYRYHLLERLQNAQ